jgi:hypothetical protein
MSLQLEQVGFFQNEEFIALTDEELAVIEDIVQESFRDYLTKFPQGWATVCAKRE